MPGIINLHLQQMYYGHQCHDGCQHDLITLNDDDIDAILNDFALALHKGELTGKGIHPGLYSETARKLTEAVTKGMGKVSFSFDDPNNALKAQLLANVHAFSGAKALTENAVFSELLFDEKGDLKPFKKFLQDIRQLHIDYNKNYLSAEYGQAIAASQTALLWNQYSDDDWLEYRTVGDDRVRELHQKMDGITLQKKDPFWNTHWPPNAWGCRCTVVPADEPKQPITGAEAGRLSKGAIESKIFEYNSGQSCVIFTNDMPYFKSHRGINKLDGIKNYGLRSVKKILEDENLPARLHVDTQTDYYAWWSDMVKKNGVNETDFVIKDKTGTSILFESRPGKNAHNYFKDHILSKDKENRHEFAINMADIVSVPDELWKNDKGWVYLKYYNDGLYAVIADLQNDLIKAITMYRVHENNYMQIRKGILIK